MEIIPAILAQSARDFDSRVNSPVMNLTSLVHIDVMDSSFTTQACISHPDLLPQSFSPDIELHLMVNSPVSYIEQWSSVPQLKRVIIHSEIEGDVTRALLLANDLDIDCSLALNPGTPLSALNLYQSLISSVLVMGVEPGASGQSFLGEPILAKINELKHSFPELSVAVDGGVSQDLIPTLRDLGVARACASSAIWSSKLDPVAAFKRLSFL